MAASTQGQISDVWKTTGYPRPVAMTYHAVIMHRQLKQPLFRHLSESITIMIERSIERSKYAGRRLLAPIYIGMSLLMGLLGKMTLAEHLSHVHPPLPVHTALRRQLWQK